MEPNRWPRDSRTANVVALLAALSLLGACGGGAGTAAQNPSGAPLSANASLPPAVAQAQTDKTAGNPAIVSADNTFGLNLFQNLDRGGTANIAISPTSIAVVLQILFNGAAGTTQQAMSQTLQLQGLSATDVNEANAALQASLVNPDPAIALTLANSLWMHLGDNPVLPSFTQVNETYYGAQVGDLAGAPANVDAWVSNETHGLITSILPPMDFADVVAVIVNAIYFKGAWSVPFDPAQTAAATFTQLNGISISCQMMHQSGTFAYFDGGTFQALRIPYGTNRPMSMLILLPGPGISLDEFVASLTSDTLNGWISQLQSRYGDVALPRFTSTYSASLVSSLGALGMGIAFNPIEADFAGIAPGVYLSEVEHKTVVEVDESGTVAAGATSGGTSITAVGTAQFNMTMDHPFVYAIRDDENGALLFIGSMVDPDQ